MIVHPVYALTRRRDAATGLKRGGAAQGIQFSRSRPAHRHPLRCGYGGVVDIALDASPSDIAGHSRRRKKAGISVAIRRGTGDFKAFLIFPEPFQRFLGKSGGSEGVLGAWRGKQRVGRGTGPRRFEKGRDR